MTSNEATGWKYAAVAFVLLLVSAVTTGCCSAQVAADKDAQWRGLCHEQARLMDCGCGPRGEVFTPEQVALRLRLIGERLDRMGMNCVEYKP